MSDARPLENHRSLIVGASSGIGRASAELLLRDGATVTLAGRTESRLIETAKALEPVAAQSGGQVKWVTCDASRRDSVREAVDAACHDGPLDSALAVPGGGNYSPVLAYDDDEFMAQIDLNVRPCFLVLKYAGLSMVQGGGGSIIAVSSTAAVFSSPFLAAYCAAKAAIDQLVKVAADELGRHRIRVNAVRPGLTETASTGGLVNQQEILDLFLKEQPLARPGRPLDQAHAVRFLAGPESSWITGQCLTVDGGHTIRKFPYMEDLARRVVGDAVFAAVERGEEPR